MTKKMQDDIREYKQLCLVFNDSMCYAYDTNQHRVIDCYGEHAEQLKQRAKTNICTYCNKAIVGGGFFIDENNYHVDCYMKAGVFL